MSRTREMTEALQRRHDAQINPPLILKPGQIYDGRHHATVLRLEADLDEAAFKAIDALSRYKFMMFGYWAAIWVHQNRVGKCKRQSPFKRLVMLARQIVAEAA